MTYHMKIMIKECRKVLPKGLMNKEINTGSNKKNLTEMVAGIEIKIIRVIRLGKKQSSTEAKTILKVL